MEEVYKLVSSEGNEYTFEEVSRYHSASIYIGIPSGTVLGGTLTLVLDNPPPLVQNTIIKFFIYHGKKETATSDNSGESDPSSSTTPLGSGSTIQSELTSSASEDSTGLPSPASSTTAAVPDEPAAVKQRARPATAKSPTAAAVST